MLGVGYVVSQCTDTPNFIFAIKQEGLGLTVKVQLRTSDYIRLQFYEVNLWVFPIAYHQ